MSLYGSTTKLEAPATDLTGQVRKTQSDSVAVGGFGQVYLGIWTNPKDNTTTDVAIKIFIGVHTREDHLDAMTRRLTREARVWRTLHHPNILPFLGICSGIGPSPALISPFCKSGNISDFLRDHPTADKMNIIIGAAEGIRYLHSENVIHGDIKSENVLIADGGIPRVCDFGRSKVIDHQGYTTAFTGAVRFLAPELITTDDDSPVGLLTKKTDVYAFAMLMLQVLSGRLPYYYTTDFKVMLMVNNGTVPNRAKYVEMKAITDKLWHLMEGAWAHDAQSRLTMDQLVVCLRSINV